MYRAVKWTDERRLKMELCATCIQYSLRRIRVSCVVFTRSRGLRRSSCAALCGPRGERLAPAALGCSRLQRCRPWRPRELRDTDQPGRRRQELITCRQLLWASKLIKFGLDIYSTINFYYICCVQVKNGKGELIIIL